MSRNWYAACVLRDREEAARAEIERLSIAGRLRGIHEVIIPVERSFGGDGETERDAARKLVPGYMLLDIEDIESNLKQFHAIPDIVGFVVQDEIPAPVSERDVARIRARSTKA